MKSPIYNSKIFETFNASADYDKCVFGFENPKDLDPIYVCRSCAVERVKSGEFVAEIVVPPALSLSGRTDKQWEVWSQCAPGVNPTQHCTYPAASIRRCDDCEKSITKESAAMPDPNYVPAFTVTELVKAGMPENLAGRFIEQAKFSTVEYLDAREICCDDYCATCLRQGLDEDGFDVSIQGVSIYNPITGKHDNYTNRGGAMGHEEIDHRIVECTHCGEHVEGANSPIHDKALSAKLHAENDARIAAKSAAPTYVCGECGSLDVSFVWWHDANPGKDYKVPLPTEMDPTDCSCSTCRDDCQIITIEAWEAKQEAERAKAENQPRYWHCYRDNAPCVMDGTVVHKTCRTIESARAVAKQMNENEARKPGPYWYLYRMSEDDVLHYVMDENRLTVARCNSKESANALVKELNEGARAVRLIKELKEARVEGNHLVSKAGLVQPILTAITEILKEDFED